MHRLLRTGIALVGLRLTLLGASSIALTALPVALTCLRRAAGRHGISRAARGAAAPGRAAGDRHRGLRLHRGGGDVAGDPRAPCRDRVRGDLRGAVRLRRPCCVTRGWRGISSAPHRGTPAFFSARRSTTPRRLSARRSCTRSRPAPEALAAASVAKLLRNLSIAVLVPLAAWLTQRHEARERGAEGAGARRAPRRCGAHTAAGALVRAGFPRLHRAAHRWRCAVHDGAGLAGTRQPATRLPTCS